MLFRSPTSSRRKAIRTGHFLMATIRNMKLTRGGVWVKKARSRSGFDISRLVGNETGSPSSRPDGTLHGTPSTRRRCHGSRGHAARSSDQSRPGDLRTTNMHGSAGDWHYQIVARIPSIHVARIGRCQGRIEFGSNGVAHEENVRAGGVVFTGLSGVGRVGEACHACGTLIKQIVQGQRSSFYCQVCQK